MTSDVVDWLEAPPCRFPASELLVTFARSGGPGGQHVNKTETKAVVRFDLAASPSIPPELKERAMRKLASRLSADGVLIVTASRTRSQATNREDAIGKLCTLLSRAFELPKLRKPTRPTAASRERRLRTKRALASKKRQRTVPEGE